MKKFLSIILFLSLLSEQALANFSDLGRVPYDLGNGKTIMATRPYVFAIHWLAENDLIEGYEDGTFRPDNSINRAEFLKMFFTVMQTDVDSFTEGVVNKKPFPDVDPNVWYGKYVIMAKSKGIIQGYPDGTFKPERPISRAEALKIIMKEIYVYDQNKFIGDYIDALAPLDKAAITGCYKKFLRDVPDNAWFENYIIFAHEKCIIPEQMVGDHLFYPGKNLERDEMAEVIFRARAAYDNQTTYSIALYPKLNP